MKAIFKSIFIIFILSFIVFSFSTCKKDTECDAVITVKLESDTTSVVPGALVELKKHDVYIQGISDAAGQFRHTFKLDAILDVAATLNGTPDTLSGATVIRLKPGETVYKTVFIK
ncbi:MAG TPA: hypothetical protein PKK00_07915 [Bacteroidales bacterium]|nr:hypothetical protein [Bacteroidales bacterium]HPS15817.1 hypothetical protein [Bacteroidales bacterium]